MSKQIIICADDFAQNEAISAGILSLMKERRINATSCLVNSMHWDDVAPELDKVKQTHFIGLHLNLTFGQPLSAMWRKHEGEVFYGLPRLLRRVYLRRLDMQVLMAEIQAQIDVFTHTMCIYPDFIDGHQHIHQLPMIRQALLAVYRKQMGHFEQAEPDEQHMATFFRHTNNGCRDMFSLTGFPKCQALALLGGRRFKRLLIRDQLPTNTSFSGIYHFKNAASYRKYFKRFLSKTKEGGLIMCHPGYASQDYNDPLQAYRQHELNYLLSDYFLTDMEDNSFRLMRHRRDN